MRPESEILSGLEPFISPETHFLILGSFPSITSLKDGFYYAHPRNRFFFAVAHCFGEEEPKTIYERQRFLLTHRISLFDTIKKCRRSGSLDADIKEIQLNDLTPFIGGEVKIACTGKTSYSIFKKLYPAVAVSYLPSPSPANQRCFSLLPYQEFFLN